MRVSLNPRARRLLRRVPRANVYTLLDILLLTLLAIQAARLAWALVTPVGPLGDWRPAAAMRLAAPPAGAVLSAFDPFFRLQGAAGPAQVTTLNLVLHGTREDRASGRGSAIIATPDGRQASFTVGQEVMPGVTLIAVGFDSVTLSRGGASEQLFLDQSTPAPIAGGTPGGALPPIVQQALPAQAVPPPQVPASIQPAPTQSIASPPPPPPPAAAQPAAPQR